MSFLAPLFLVGALAAAVPLVLHLLKRHTEPRVRFAAVFLLEGAPVEHTARRRLRELVLLALRVGALVLLALAFARPLFRSTAAARATLTVVAVDTSLSMSAPATVSRARALGLDAVRTASAGDDVAVVTFSDRADVILKPTGDRGAATTAVEAVTPGFGSTRYAAAFAAAGELFSGRTGAIVVITDLQASGWDGGDHAAVPQGVRVEVQDAGVPPPNLSIDALRSDGDRIVATIRNTGDRAREVRARLTVDGRRTGESTVLVEGHGTADAMFTNVRATGVAAASLDDPSGIPGDNTRYALLGGNAPGSMLVITATGDLDKDAWYVRHALAGVRGVAAADNARWTEDDLNRYPLIILLSTRGLERRGREKIAAFLGAGGGLLIAAGPDVDGEIVADVLGPWAPLEVRAANVQNALTLAPADVRHPIFRSFGGAVASLGLVQFRAVAHIAGRSCQAIARFASGDSAVLDCEAGEGRAIVVASDLNNRWNDFAVHASFVPFLDQTARYLSNGATRGSEYVVGDVPAGVPAAPGVSTLKTAAGSRRVVVNVDARESAIDRMSAAVFQAAVTPLKDAAARDLRVGIAEQENRQHLWQYLLAAMVLAVMTEGVVARLA